MEALMEGKPSLSRVTTEVHMPSKGILLVAPLQSQPCLYLLKKTLLPKHFVSERYSE